MNSLDALYSLVQGVESMLGPRAEATPGFIKAKQLIQLHGEECGNEKEGEWVKNVEVQDKITLPLSRNTVMCLKALAGSMYRSHDNRSEETDKFAAAFDELWETIGHESDYTFLQRLRFKQSEHDSWTLEVRS